MKPERERSDSRLFTLRKASMRCVLHDAILTPQMDYSTAARPRADRDPRDRVGTGETSRPRPAPGPRLSEYSRSPPAAARRVRGRSHVSARPWRVTRGELSAPPRLCLWVAGAPVRHEKSQTASDVGTPSAALPSGLAPRTLAPSHAGRARVPKRLYTHASGLHHLSVIAWAAA